MDTQAEEQPGNRPASGYWFTPLPVYLLDAAIDPDSPVNGSAVVLWAHLHRHYAWRKRVFPSHATLAAETGQSDSAIRRQMLALREIGAIDWGANYGPKGRSSNEYALAPVKPFEFDRGTVPPVTVKNERHHPVTVKNDGGVEVISDRHPPFKNERVIESTEELETLSPRLPQQTVEDERETIADANKSTNRLTAAQKAVRGIVPIEDEPAFIAWVTAECKVRTPAFWRTAADDMPELAATWRAKQAGSEQRASPVSLLPDWCTHCGDGGTAARTNPNYRYRGEQPCPACHPDMLKESA